MGTAEQEILIRSVRTLTRRDPILKDAVKAFGLPASRKQTAGFATLARVVVDQQLSTLAAAAIWRRLRSTVGRIGPDSILAARETDLRAAGLSGGKVKTLRALSDAVASGALNLRTLTRKDDTSTKELLTQVWGIGDWTAEIYMMFAMGRPDVWPAGDLALRTGWQTVTADAERISAEDLAAIAEAWRPHRSAAAILLWHAVGAARQKSKA